MALDILPEDLPEAENRVTLDHDVVDNTGLPTAKISYRLSENTRRIREFNIDRATEALRAAGANEVYVADSSTSGVVHLLGTARMGASREDSVVDQWGRTHDIENLYIIDGSTFVTAGAVNPASTIAAIAKRNVTHLIGERRNQVGAQ